MSIDQKIKDACQGNEGAFVVCRWDVARPRIEPRIVQAFIPQAGGIIATGEAAYDAAEAYARRLQAEWDAKPRPGLLSAEQVMELQLNPGAIEWEVDYFVADASACRVY